MSEQDDVTQASLSDGPDTGEVLEEMMGKFDSHGDPYPIMNHDEDDIPQDVLAEVVDVVPAEIHEESE